MSKSPDILLPPSFFKEREAEQAKKEKEIKTEKKEAAKKAKAEKKSAKQKAKMEKKAANQKVKMEKKAANQKAKQQAKSSDTAFEQQPLTIEVTPKATETASMPTFSPMSIGIIASALALCVLATAILRHKNKK